MRRLAILLSLALMAAGCAERPSSRPAAPPPEEETGEPFVSIEPGELPGATCGTTNKGNPANLPDFVGVEVGSEDGIDRITFRFQPAPDAPPKPPWHFVNFTEQLITEGEGSPVEVEGDAFLVVSFQAIGTDLSGETPVEVYTGAKRFTPAFPTLREAVMLGDFEAQVSWGLGLAQKACYRIDAGPDHLTVEFPSA